MLRHALFVPIVAVVLLIVLVHVQYVMLRGQGVQRDVLPLRTLLIAAFR